MPALALWTIVAVAVAGALAWHGELRRLAGAWIAGGASVCAALGSVPILQGSSIGLRVAMALQVLAAALLLAALAWLYRDLIGRRWLLAGLYDIESGLPNRSQWERWLVRHGDWQAVRVSFQHIGSTRRLAEDQVEKAFFNWLGQQLIERQQVLPGFVARLSLRDIGFLLPSQADAAGQVERLLAQLGNSLRSGGFEARYQVRPIRRSGQEQVES